MMKTLFCRPSAAARRRERLATSAHYVRTGQGPHCTSARLGARDADISAALTTMAILQQAAASSGTAEVIQCSVPRTRAPHCTVHIARARGLGKKALAFLQIDANPTMMIEWPARHDVGGPCGQEYGIGKA